MVNGEMKTNSVTNLSETQKPSSLSFSISLSSLAKWIVCVVSKRSKSRKLLYLSFSWRERKSQLDNCKTQILHINCPQNQKKQQSDQPSAHPRSSVSWLIVKCTGSGVVILPNSSRWAMFFVSVLVLIDLSYSWSILLCV